MMIGCKGYRSKKFNQSIRQIENDMNISAPINDMNLNMLVCDRFNDSYNYGAYSNSQCYDEDSNVWPTIFSSNCSLLLKRFYCRKICIFRKTPIPVQIRIHKGLSKNSDGNETK